jgi:AraC-like DNA-binding protein
VLKLEYNHTDYAELLKDFAKFFKCSIKDNTLQLPAEIGDGYMKLVELPNGLQGIISDYTVHQEILFKRTKINKDYFTLRFDEVFIPDAAVAEAERQLPSDINPIRSAVYLGSAKFDWLFLSTRGTRVKGVNIFFSKEWLEHFLAVESVGELIKKYLSLKMSAFNYEPMDMEYKRILEEIVNTQLDGSFKSLVIQNRIMLLLERFFTRIYFKMSDSHFDVKLTNDDITTIRDIAKELVKDFSVEPPGIAKLAKMAVMSPSKLKNSFKEIYGLPIFQYFQKQRMYKAKAMLVSKKYTVKEVGIEVGYSNLSNFAKAFKKSFDQLPSDLFNR